jgi:hypothetical protein
LERRIGKVIDKLEIEIGEVRKQNSDLERQGGAGSNASIVPKVPPNGVGQRNTFKDFVNNLGGMGGGGQGPNEEVQGLIKKIMELKMHEEAKKIVDQEI